MPIGHCHRSREISPSMAARANHDECEAVFKGWAFALLAALLLGMVGCSSTDKRASDPFVTSAPPARPSPEAYGANAQQTSNGVNPVSFEQSISSSNGVNMPEFGSLEREEEDESFLAPLAPNRVYKKMLSGVGLGPDEELARREYAEGEEKFRAKDYAAAIGHFKSAAFRWPDSPLEEDALFQLAECYFFSDKYPKASDTYANLLKKYQNSRHLDTVVARQFAVAQYWEQEARGGKQGWPNFTDKTRPFFDLDGNAVAIYESIWLNDPTGPLADDAVMATATSHFEHGRWQNAAVHYERLRTQYPQSEHQAKAHLLGMQSQLEAYQGPLYDGGSLEAAGELAGRAITQFANELPGERERLSETQRAVRNAQARRDWEMGEYYYRTKYYGSARRYYAEVLRNFPETPYAQTAQQRMEETKDLPPVPPNRFEWLTNIFE